MKIQRFAWALPGFTLTLVACALSISSAKAQTDTAPPAYHPFDVGLEVGTTGPGISASWRFMDQLGVRAGLNYLTYDRNGTIKDVNYDANLRLASEPLTLDWYPWDTRSFHVSAGIALNETRITGVGDTTSGTVTLNGHTYNPGQLGTLNLRIKQQLVNPYLSIGGNFFYFDHAHHWALDGELGAMYTGKPSVSLTHSGGNGTVPQSQINADLAAEQEKLQKFANDLKFWPVLKIGVNYSF